jgi:hypothetical protein
MAKRKTRVQVVVVTVPNTSPAGAPIEAQITLDKAYDSAKGVAVSIGNGFATSGNTYVDVGLRDAYGTIVDDQHMEALQASSAVAPDNKYLSIDLKNNNQLIFARVIPPILTTSQFTIQFRFLLVDDNEVIARV